MRILLQKRGNTGWSADITDLPGSPWVGIGVTEADAIADVFAGNLRLECYHNHLFKLVAEKVEIVRET